MHGDAVAPADRVVLIGTSSTPSTSVNTLVKVVMEMRDGIHVRPRPAEFLRAGRLPPRLRLGIAAQHVAVVVADEQVVGLQAARLVSIGCTR